MRGECRIWRVEIEDGRAPLSRGARAHMVRCTLCHAARHEGEGLFRLVGELGRVDAPPDFDFRLRARLAARRTPWLPAARTTRYASVSAATVACFALLIFAMHQGHRGQEVALRNPEVAEAPAVAPESPGEDSVPISREVAEEHIPVAVTETGAGRRLRRSHAMPARHTSGGTSRGSYARREIASLGQREIRGASFGEAAFGVVVPQVTIPVGSAGEPLRVLLRDERGAVRSLPTRAVSFGAQRVFAREKREGSNSVAETEGVW